MRQTLSSILGLLAFAGAAIGQTTVKQVAITTPASVDPSDPEDLGSRPVDAAIGVNDEAVVVLSNMRMSIFARTGGSHLDTGFPDGNAADFPFKKVDTTAGRFFDPRTEYDKENDRLWMMYSEDNAKYPGGNGGQARIHLAVSRAEPSGGLDSFDTDDWYYFTGIGGTAIDGEALNLGEPLDPQVDPQVTPFRAGQGHNPFLTLADLPAMSIDERAVYLTPYSLDAVPTGQTIGTVVIIPIEHSNGSMLDGDRPSETDIIMMNRNELDDPTGERNLPDDSIEAYAVQEPFDQFANAQFFLSLPVEGGINEGIRLGGLWFESGQWKYRQRVDTSPGTTPTDLEDMELNPNSTTADALRFYDSSGGYRPMTPDEDDFRPAASSAFIASAVLVYDNQNSARIFAAHHVIPVDTSGSSEQREQRFVVQWYVIDPDLTNLRNLSNKWDPEIVASGRIDNSTGDRYHATIGVTPQGVAHLQYTFSDDSTYPQVRQAVLNSSYTGIVSETVVQAGPSAFFDTTEGSGWADYADMQADPLYCGFWSAHTLAKDLDERDEWMFFLPMNCQSPNLNFDGGTDPYDMAMFNSYYATGARRVDMNTDGTTDATDAAIYADEYDKATGP